MRSTMRLSALLCIIAFWSFNSARSQASLGQPEDESTSTLPLRAASPQRIAGGEETDPDDFPWQASLQNERHQHFCGGTIIGSRYILTAAHCVTDKKGVPRPVASMNVVVGTNTLRKNTTREGERYEIEVCYIHPNYSTEWQADGKAARSINDIAVIILKEEIEENDYQQSIELVTDNIVCDGEVTISGFGCTDENSTALSPDLKSLTVRIYNSLECVQNQGTALRFSEIGGVYPPGFGTCEGDSGGPVVQYGKLVGVISRHSQNRRTGEKVMIFQKVRYYKDFIEDIIDEYEESV